MLKRLPLIASIAQMAVLILSCGPGNQNTGQRLHELFQEEWETRLKENPEFATFLGDDRYNDRLTDLSLTRIEQRHEWTQGFLQRLLSMDRARLGDADKLNYDLFKKQLEFRVERYPYHDFLMPVNQMGGLQIDFPNLVNITPFRNVRDYDNYLARLAAFPTYVDQTIALMREGMKTGMVLPGVVLRTVPDQIEAQSELEVQESPFYGPFTKMPDAMADSVKDQYRTRGASAIESNVFPPFQRFYTFFVNDYLPVARQEISVTALPGGKNYYRFLVAYHTTTSLTPDEIHKIGLSEVKRIRQEMKQIMKDVHFDGSFLEFLEFLRTDPRFYTTSEEELLDAYRVICKRADPELAKLFGKLPRMPYGVIPIPDYQAPSAPTAYYYPPSADGSWPGYFWANTYDLTVRPKYEMEALALHEAVPGHHLQIALAQELEGVPEFRKHGGFTAFVEGWGLYAESLGEEMGFYSDPYSKFGQLTYEMWRACRLVVDTGMHVMGWSRGEAIDFMKKNTAKTNHDIVVEIDRYIVWPGQALAYKVGELKIKELRARAEEVLGDDFDIREFHDAVLGNGALPLDILEQEVKLYIEKKRSG
ncbi:MAG: DUF885 family protein [Fidelibacterota bacterium]